MKSRTSFLLILVLVLISQSSLAQEEVDTARVIRPIIPSLYIDYGKLVTYGLPFEKKIEIGAELLIQEKIPIIIEYGTATLNPNKVYANGFYESQGSYLRIGTGFYSQWLPKNKIGITGRYGISSFDEKATVSTDAPLNLESTLTNSFQRTSLSASWLELVLYTDAKLFSTDKYADTILQDLLVIGMNLRYRYLLNYDLQTPDDVHSIPGYGRSFDNHIPAVNLFLKVSF